MFLFRQHSLSDMPAHSLSDPSSMLSGITPERGFVSALGFSECADMFLFLTVSRSLACSLRYRLFSKIAL